LTTTAATGGLGCDGVVGRPLGLVFPLGVGACGAVTVLGLATALGAIVGLGWPVCMGARSHFSTLSVGCDWPLVARMIRLLPATRTAREIMTWCPLLVVTVAVATCP
jgi:hypothetical protein